MPAHYTDRQAGCDERAIVADATPADAACRAQIQDTVQDRQRLIARALRIGGRLRISDAEAGVAALGEVIASSPLMLRVGNDGFATLFPYGTVVLLGLSQAQEKAVLQKLGSHLEGALEAPVVLTSQIEIGSDGKLTGDVVTVPDLSLPCLVVVADALAKDVALAFEEDEVKKVFEVLEPLTRDLASSGRLPRSRRGMLRTVGHALLIHHHLFEPVEVEERPDMLLNHDDIERLHDRLAAARHFKKRAKALSRKIGAIEAMTTALTEMLDARREIRLEVLIIILIAMEMSIYLYDLFVRGG